MTINIFRIAAWTLLGWVLFRSAGAVMEKGTESGPDGSGEDASSEPGSAGGVQAAGRVADAPAAAEPEAVQVPQDLRKIRGIGPAIATLLNASGIATWAQLAAAKVTDLEAILEEAGPRYRVHDPSTWPAQAAELAQAN